MIDRCFIYQKAHQGGIRHSKLPKFKPVVDARLPGHYHPNQMTMLNRPASTRIEEAARWLSERFSPVSGFQPKESLEFENWMYRFWQPDFDEKGKMCSAECRGCGSSFVQPAMIRQHIGQMGCSKTICAAFKLLLKDMKCVICDSSCRGSQQKWGVPLCSSACEEAWCNVECRPRSLELAIQCAEKQGLC